MHDASVLVHEALANFAPIKETDSKCQARDVYFLNIIASLAFDMQDSFYADPGKCINADACKVAEKIIDLIGKHPAFSNLDEMG